MELCQGRGVAKLIKFCQAKLQLLLSNDVTPVLVFDGARLQMKSQTEDERKANRENHLQKAEQYLAEGNRMMAQKMFSIAVDITPEMAFSFV
jgi:exonuclease 1